LWFLIIFTTAAAGLLLAFGRLSVRLEYQRQGRDDHLFLEVAALWGLFRYRVTVPVLGVRMAAGGIPRVNFEVATGDKREVTETCFTQFMTVFRLLQYFGRLYTRYRQAFLYLWHRLRVRRFAWHTLLGTGDPASTGVTCGLLWSVKGFLAGRIAPRRGTSLRISVKPDFFRPVFGTSLNLTASLALRHLLVAGFYLLRGRGKTRRGW